MRLAVINEISAADRNADILKALDGRGYEVLNLGNQHSGEQPELLYIHTGLMSALLLHLKAVDFVIGGCGTGLGYLNSVLQYPGIFCGHLLNPLDAWLYARINAGNCVSLALNQGYGWAGEINLRLIFDNLFSKETGSGYPPGRAEPQRLGRIQLAEVSSITHRPMTEILTSLPRDVTYRALSFPIFQPILEDALEADPQMRAAVHKILS
ncbi:MAG: RpiB/LacA/LacB family sugar-phosphate isomerase [Anaerolineaceae bacterium]|nr:RpiB/LacA/LacB family sugar-phosphate isomerase [Anaerolineaceae bacterium]MBN2676656.1 RpiB/LacA/LacB family sugar-phosphate isomerase [Anaerolineaceae bacterium]